MEENAIIEIQNMSFGFPNAAPLFENLSFSIQEGAFYLFRGASGAGKSTLLRLLTRFEEPTTGEIRYRDKPLAAYSPPDLRRTLIHIQQTPAPVEGSVEQNLLLPFSFKHNRHLEKPDRRHIEMLLDAVHLANVGMNDHAKTLSVGQLQRLCLIRGLLLNPDALLLDEPTSALDRESTAAVMALLEQENLQSKRTIISVHHKTIQQGNVPYRRLELLDGRIEETP